MTSQSLSATVQSTLCQYSDCILDQGVQLYGQATVEAGRAYRYLGQKACEAYNYIVTIISQIFQRICNYINEKYSQVYPSLDQLRKNLVTKYEDCRNDLNRLLDGSALQHYLSTDDFNKDYIILHTVAWGIIGGFLFGNLGALAASSIAFSGLSKPK